MKRDFNIGKVTVVLGPVVDVKFETKLPKIYEKVIVDTHDLIASGALSGSIADGFVTLEVMSHIPPSTARCIALEPTEG
ncbi:MAG: hypothetical protein K2L88_02940, partial [Clostridiales bacterium]|nr:hypothetical protein [Clostridiales bacterium]